MKIRFTLNERPTEVEAEADRSALTLLRDDLRLTGTKVGCDTLDCGVGSVLYDDRPKVSPGVKFKDAELLGMPTILVVGKGLADGTVEVKDRRSGERTEVPVADAVSHLVSVVRG